MKTKDDAKSYFEKTIHKPYINLDFLQKKIES